MNDKCGNQQPEFVFLYSRSFCSLCLAALFVFGGQQPAAADLVLLPTTLDQLTAPGAYTEGGGLTFYNFSGVSVSGNASVDISAISVSAFMEGNQVGLTLTPNPGLLSVQGSDGSEELDFSFYVQPMNSSGLITGSGINLLGAANGNAFASTSTEVQNNSQNNIPIIATNFTTFDGIVGNQPTDSSAFAGVPSILVSVDINLESFDDVSSSSISQASYYFQYNTVSVPEPSSIITVGIIVITFAGYSLYRRQKLY